MTTTTSSLSSTQSLAPSSSSSILTVTITRDDAAASITPSVSSESVLITDTPNTISSDLTLVYVFSKSASDDSSSSRSPSGSNPPDLSAGAIAGIVIGAILLLIVLVLVVFCTSRRFARKRRREEASLRPSTQQRASRAAPSNSSYPAARSQRSTIYPPNSPPNSPPQELATHFNRLEADGRGKPAEVLGSYVHPAELHAGSQTDLVARARKGPSPPAPRKDEGEGGVIYIMPPGRGDDVTSEAGSAVCLSPPGTWETASWGASVSGQSHIVSIPGTRVTPSKASSRDTLGNSTHTKE
jgi:hypothetical protein